MFGKSLDFLNRRCERRQTCLRWQYFMLIKPIKATRIIRKFTIVIFTSWGKLPHVWTLPPPEDLKNHKFKPNEAKIFRPKYDTVSGEFLGRVEALGYLTIRGDSMECYFHYGCSKENGKVLNSHHQMKIPNSFSGTIFNRHRIQNESGALDTESSKTYFFCALYNW